MSFNDLPLSVLFLIFVWLFLLIGFIPLFSRARAKMRRLRQEKQAGAQSGPGSLQDPPTTAEARPTEQIRFSDYEALLLRSLARAGRKGLPRRSLQAEVAADSAELEKALDHLQGRGMIGIALNLWRGVRYRLTARGRRYAESQGYTPLWQGRR